MYLIQLFVGSDMAELLIKMHLKLHFYLHFKL